MKHRKSLFAALLCLSLLIVCAAPAYAADALPYQEQLNQDTYTSALLLTTDSYPEVCIGPNYFDSVYISQYKTPYFVHFPCPAGTFCLGYDESSCTFADMQNDRLYLYSVHDQAAFETFVNEAEKDEYILANGSDGLAIILDPSRCEAYALLSATDIDKNAKVQISVRDSTLDGLNEQQIIDGLTSLIQSEAARVQSAMRVDEMADYWSRDRYAGFKMLSTEPNSNSVIVTCTLPAGYFITAMNTSDSGFTFAKVGEKDTGIMVDMSLEPYQTYVEYQMEKGEEPDHISSVDVDGTEYRVYAHFYDEDTVLSIYADRLIAENTGRMNDHTLRLVFKMELDGSDQVSSMAEAEALVKEIASGIQVDYDQIIPDYHNATPYADSVSATTVTGPGPVVATEEQGAEQAPADSGVWVCDSCGAENTGNFCANCGAAKPEQSQQLVCANCGFVVPEGETPKFCSNCGAPF